MHGIYEFLKSLSSLKMCMIASALIRIRYLLAGIKEKQNLHIVCFTFLSMALFPVSSPTFLLSFFLSRSFFSFILFYLRSGAYLPRLSSIISSQHNGHFPRNIKFLYDPAFCLLLTAPEILNEQMEE